MDVYMKRSELQMKFNPKRQSVGDGLIPLVHPELFITDKIRVKTYPEGFQSELPDSVSFRCNLILTNPTHDGIWLCTNHHTEKTGLLYGYIGASDWALANKSANYTILNTFARAMISASEVCRQSVEIDPIFQMSTEPTVAEFKDIMYYALRTWSHLVNDLSPDNMTLYYRYWLDKGDSCQHLQDMEIYLVLEVTTPDYKVASLSDHTMGSNNGGYWTWYTRKDHAINLAEKHNKAGLFNCLYPDDIRLTEVGIDTLTHIFQTKDIFGKLDIY